MFEKAEFSPRICIDDIEALIKRDLQHYSANLNVFSGDGEFDGFTHYNYSETRGISYFDGIRLPENVALSGCFISKPSALNGASPDVHITCDDPRGFFIDFVKNIMSERHQSYLSHNNLNITNGKSNVHETAIISQNAIIGADCEIAAGAIINCSVILEDGVSIKEGTVVGSSGAAIHVKERRTLFQPHLGRVIIGEGCEIGSQCNVVRGIFGSTVIGRRTIVGNQVNIGHNVNIGVGSWLGVGAAIGGFTKVGDFTNIGMGAQCKNGLTIGDNCNVAMGSVLSKSMHDFESCFGNPAKIIRTKLVAGAAQPFGNQNAN